MIPLLTITIGKGQVYGLGGSVVLFGAIGILLLVALICAVYFMFSSNEDVLFETDDTLLLNRITEGREKKSIRFKIEEGKRLIVSLDDWHEAKSVVAEYVAHKNQRT